MLSSPLLAWPLSATVDMKLVYKRYASLYFVAGITEEENELMVLEVIHRYVETLDRYFENVIASVAGSFLIVLAIESRCVSWI